MRRVWIWIGIAALIVVVASPSFAGQNVLQWQDNATNELNFHIERTTAATVAACQTASGWAALGTPLGPNVTTFTDLNATEGTTYCYRVSASNTAGVSAFSNIAGRTVPFTVPAAPSSLTVN